MAEEAYFQPSFVQAFMGQPSSEHPNLTSDTFVTMLYATSGLAARGTSEGFEYVSQLTANGGSALTEVSTSGTGYSRQDLTSVSWTYSGLVVTFTAANPSWSSATFSCYYAAIYDGSIGSGDSTYPLMMIFDLGGVQTVTGATFTLAVNASGLFTATMAQ
jgi:hypothetical protein